MKLNISVELPSTNMHYKAKHRKQIAGTFRPVYQGLSLKLACMQLQQIQTIHHDAELGEIPEDAPFVSPARTPFVSHELIDEWRLYGDYIYIYHRFRNAVALRDVLAQGCIVCTVKCSASNCGNKNPV